MGVGVVLAQDDRVEGDDCQEDGCMTHKVLSGAQI